VGTDLFRLLNTRSEYGADLLRNPCGICPVSQQRKRPPILQNRSSGAVSVVYEILDVVILTDSPMLTCRNVDGGWAFVPAL